MRIIDADEAVRTLKRMAKDCIFAGKLREGEEYAIAACVLNREELADELSGRDINNHIRQLEAMVTKWISVEAEQKPKHGEVVLCRYVVAFCKTPWVKVLKYYAHGDNGYVTGAHFTNEGVCGMRVTHWMPLPEPPKEDNHAENDRS